MAHGNYDCCAICDTEVRYNTNAPAKGVLCRECCDALRASDVLVCGAVGLKAWMLQIPEQAQPLLSALKFRECCYPNSVDDTWKSINKSQRNISNENGALQQKGDV
jgi:hypothetical protein